MNSFETTRWSIIRKAGSPGSDGAHDAYVHLCSTYWSPLYAFLRRRGYEPDDARDLVQEFLTRLLEREALSKVDPEKGKFRTFLLACLNNLLKDEWAKENTQKRIPKGAIIRLDAAEAERLYGQTPSYQLTPEQLFDREWAMSILRNALNALRDEHRRNGKLDQFNALAPYLTAGANSVPYAELSQRIQKDVNAIKAAVHRLRARYREAIRDQIAETVASNDDLEEELRYMLSVVGGAGASVVQPPQ